MLQAKQHVSYGYSLEIRRVNSISPLWKSCISELLHLLTPADTSVQLERRRDTPPVSKSSNARSLLKVLLWVIISLITSIALGQLN